MAHIKLPAKNWSSTSRYLAQIWVAVFACVLLLQSPTALAEKPSLKVGVSGRLFFQHVDENGSFTGLDVELSKLIFEEAGFDVQFIHYPWVRIVHLVKLGKLDVALSAGESEERKLFAYFSKQTLRQGQNFLFTLKDKAEQFSGLNQLIDLKAEQHRIAVYRGARYSTEYDDLMKQPWFKENLIILDSQPRTVESLTRGRSDALIGSEYGVVATAKKMGIADQIVPVFPLMTYEEAKTHLMFSKKSVPQEWVDQIDAAMERLKASGKYQQTLNAYIESL